MKDSYSGNIKSIASVIDRVNREWKIQFLPTNIITRAKLENNEFELSGIFRKAIGKIEEQKDSASIDLRVRLKRHFTFIGVLIVLLLTTFLWAENVTIDGDSAPSLLKRLSYVSIGLILFVVIPSRILKWMKADFEDRVLKLIM